MRKKPLILVVVVVLGLFLFLLSRDWSSPELGQRLLDKAGEATGMEMSAQGFRFNLLEGVVLEGVKASSSQPGRSFELSLDRLVFEHRIAPLLAGTVSVRRIVLDKPGVELIESAATASKPKTKVETAKPAPTEKAGGGTGGLSLEIETIAIRGGSVVIRPEKGEAKKPTHITDLDLKIEDFTLAAGKGSVLEALSGGGEIEIREVVFDTLKARDVEGLFRVADGRFTLSPLTFQLDEGPFTAELEIDFNPVPFTYTLSARADPLDFNAVAGAEDGFGPGRLSLEASGAGTESRSVKGTGALDLAEGRLPGIPMLAQVDEKLGKSVLVGAPYKETRLEFGIANNVVRLKPFAFETEGAKLTLDGTVSLDGPLNLDFALGTAREGIQVEGVGANVLNVLADEKGWVLIPMDVRGTKEQPRVRPDAKTLMAQARQGTRRLAKEKATDALKGFFRKKKKQ